MKIKPAIIIYTPLVLVLASVAIFNPAALTWPVVAMLAVGFGVFGGFAMRLFD